MHILMYPVYYKPIIFDVIIIMHTAINRQSIIQNKMHKAEYFLLVGLRYKFVSFWETWLDLPLPQKKHWSPCDEIRM